MNDSFYKEKIKRLEAENKELKDKVSTLENDLERADRVFDRDADKYENIIAEKDAEIAILNLKILKLVREHV